MALKQTMEVFELLDSALVDGEKVVQVFKDRGLEDVSCERVYGKEKGWADFIHIKIPGKNGKSSGGTSPTLNIVGSLGGIGGRPELLGLVSDADGAIVTIASALKIADMRCNGDVLDGDVVICTNICTDSPTMPHEPAMFIGTWVDLSLLHGKCVDEKADGILITESTKGNLVINHKGFVISPTIKEGWILKISPDALAVMQRVTSKAPVVVPITMQDITPFTNSIYHLNGLAEVPAGITAPAIGVGITTEIVTVGGAATGNSNVVDMEPAVRFCVEVAKDFGKGLFKFYDEQEFQKLVSMYGTMDHLQTMGKKT